MPPTSNPVSMLYSLKGVRGGNCNRAACQAPGANWYNKGSLSWYCEDCAFDLNRTARQFNTNLLCSYAPLPSDDDLKKLHAPKLCRYGNTNIRIDESTLSKSTCGLFRASIREAYELMPELSEVFQSFEDISVVSPYNYDIDVKIHMLMPGQYPCIPNWHCDNVPRNEMKALEYSKVNVDPLDDMFIWISNGPHTEFLAEDIPVKNMELPKDHGDLSKYMSELKGIEKGSDKQIFRSLPEQQWARFNQLAPHRGVASTHHQWRIFVRATPSHIYPQRSIVSKVRRHSQVYLNAEEFTW